VKRMDLETFVRDADRFRQPHQDKYFAMYSSVYDAITTDPLLMVVPVDDHLVHRGDGVFETFKCVEGRIYNMAAHLERLCKSASALHYGLPCGPERIGEIVVETVGAGGRADCLIRMFISRGPGSFGVNPYDCPATQLYVAVARLKPPFMQLHPEGARVMTSSIPAKEPFFAGVKNCNYLPNVLMKKEAVDAGVDFVAVLDREGLLAEGATENLGIVTRDRRLLFPKLGAILKGTTMMRVAELAQALVTEGLLAEIAFTDIPPAMIVEAAEILVVGTTMNVASVREFDGRPVGEGTPGPVAPRLDELLAFDMRHNLARTTLVPGLCDAAAGEALGEALP
jgi:branched-subunit amino acid aminotransferase/4-amino-4-deoxychorismate lyase